MTYPAKSHLIPDLVIQILEFFAELTQGPHGGNQLKLATSTDLIPVIDRYLPNWGSPGVHLP